MGQALQQPSYTQQMIDSFTQCFSNDMLEDVVAKTAENNHSEHA